MAGVELPVCHIHFNHQNPTIAVVQHQQCMQCLAHLPGDGCQQILLLKQVETRTTVSSWSTASNIRGPGRTVGKIISIAGRRLEKMLSTPPEPPEVVLHRKVEQDLQEAKTELFNRKRVLLLGSADSGKFDLLKQIRLMQIESYSLQERESFRLQVLKHVTRGMVEILRELGALGLSLSVDNQHYAEQVQNMWDPGDGEPFSTLRYHALSCLWDDHGVQTVWKDREIYGFPASLSYFFSDLKRVFDIAYVPTDQDILNLESQKSGSVVEATFRHSSGGVSSDIFIIDADRCRGERRKWIHYFEDMECILFVVDLSGYDEFLVEEPSTTQMHVALHMWDSISKSSSFRQPSLILFLNKYELFENKVRTSPIKDYFPDYKGAMGDASAGVLYFKERFGRLAQEGHLAKERNVFIHVMSSTGTGMFRVLLSVLKDITLRRSTGTSRFSLSRPRSF